MRFLIPSILLSILLLGESCKHEPLLVDVPGDGDTIKTPIDTSKTPTDTSQPCDPNTVYFVQDVLPIFATYCAIPQCHDNITAQDGIRLTDYANIMASGEIDPGDPWDSDIYENLVESDPDDKMPPPSSGITLTNAQINKIYTWILQGAQNNSCEPSGGCDTTNMTYATNIAPIMTSHCTGCHSGSNPQKGIDLSNFANVKSVASSGKLLGVVTHQSGFTPMPYNQAKLDACKIAKIRNWIDTGMN